MEYWQFIRKYHLNSANAVQRSLSALQEKDINFSQRALRRKDIKNMKPIKKRFLNSLHPKKLCVFTFFAWDLIFLNASHPKKLGVLAFFAWYLVHLQLCNLFIRHSYARKSILDKHILQSLSLHKEFECIKITLLLPHYLLINIKYQLLKQNIYDIIWFIL